MKRILAFFVLVAFLAVADTTIDGETLRVETDAHTVPLPSNAETAGILSEALFLTVFKHSKHRLGKRLDTDMVRKIIKDRAKRAGITLRLSGRLFYIGSGVGLAKGSASLVEM